MGKIRLLSDELVTKIAAGEVIERPSFAVKELLENALDACATYIKIEVEEAGLKKIVVSDNGEGMDQSDLLACFLPHTTSKLWSDNLIGIQTLGFRGEALSSIAAVANLKIVSRYQEEKLGTSVEVINGELFKFQTAGSPQGTQVTISDLFFSVPARKKFLKTKRTEYRHILEVVTHYAISFPKVRFEFYHNGRLVFDLLAVADITERLKYFFGPGIYENLLPLKYEQSYLKISGFLCKPQISSSTANKQELFVNGRNITDKMISAAVKEAYGSLLETTSYPVFILFLNIPYELVDVNVHPRKETICFYDAQFVYDQMKSAVSQTLSENNLTFANLSFNRDFLPTASFAGKFLKDEVLGKPDWKLGQLADGEILQLHNLYLLCATSSGLALIDQHAASERILYEKFLQAFKKHQKEEYKLSEPVLLELSPIESEVLLENRTVFEDLGFKIYEFGEKSFKVESVPLLLQDRDIKSLIKEILDNIESGKPSQSLDKNSQKMLSYLACRAAIKAGDRLSRKQAKDLIKELSSLDLAYTCPHGRPVKVEIPLVQLDRLFKRR